MSAVHGFFSQRRRDFEADRNTRSQRFYRFIDEVLTLLMILVVRRAWHCR
jgi:putative membrane protein